MQKVLAVTTAAAGVACAVSEDVQFQAVSMLGTPLRQLDPETSHRIGILAAAYGLFPRTRKADDARLQVTALGRTFSNPIGLAAGFDKDAEAIDALLGIGLGFMEVGAQAAPACPAKPRAQNGESPLPWMTTLWWTMSCVPPCKPCFPMRYATV